MASKMSSDEGRTPTDTYKANIQKVQDEIASKGGLDEAAKITFKRVAGFALEAIEDIKKCNTIDALDGLLLVESQGKQLIEESWGIYSNNVWKLLALAKEDTKEDTQARSAQVELSKQLRNLVFWTRNAIIYELHNTCKCKDSA